jgi:hypothetical protein
VRLDIAGHDVDARGLLAAGVEQHGVGFSDAGRVAEEDLEAASLFSSGDSCEK